MDDDRATMFFIIQTSDRKIKFWFLTKFCNYGLVFEYIYINMKTQKAVNLLDDADKKMVCY